MLYHSETGNGFPLILIHGYCEHSGVWQNLIGELGKHFRVLCPDLPGFGKSPGIEETTIENVAAEINQWLDLLAIKSCTMIGHSLGGYVTLAFAEYYKDKLNSFGLFHSTATEDSPEKKKTRTGVKAFVKEHGTKKFIDSLAPALFRDETKTHNRLAYDRFLKIAYGSSEEAIADYAIAMRDRKERINILHDHSLPVFFAAGKEDKVIPIELSQKQSGKVHISFYLLENSGHMGMYEEPEKSSRIIRDFVLDSI